MKVRRMSVLVAVLVAPGVNGPVRAGEAADVRQLKEEVEQLDQKVKVLERERELEQESTAEKAKTTPLVSFGPGGFQVRSADSNFLFRVRGYPTLLVPNRDVGVQLQGDLSEAVVSYAVGVFNGVADGGSGDIESTDDDQDVAARLFLQPFRKTDLGALKGLGVGVAGTYGNQDGALRTYVSPGQQRFFSYRSGVGTNAATANVTANGDHWRLSPQGYYYWGPFGLLAEYAMSDQELERIDGVATDQRVRNTAWHVAASWFQGEHVILTRVQFQF